MSGQETDKKQSFIAEARRTQIVKAAIITLDEIGYVRASLAEIAKRAGISTALISYHFKDKEDLMNHTLMTLLDNTTSFVLERIVPAQSWRDKLHTYIFSNLEYQETHRQQYHALLEIVFNARTPENVPYYKLDDDQEEPLLVELEQILSSGQKSGEFREFNVLVMAKAIQGAIGEHMTDPSLPARVDTVSYGEELVRIFDRAVLRDKKSVETLAS